MMKKLVFSLGVMFLLQSSAWAGNVSINFASDSLFSPCQLPANVMFLIGGTATGYNQGDSVDVYLAFGDGQDTSFKSQIRNTNNFFLSLQHIYTMPGIYTVLYAVTGPDGASDSLVVPNEVLLGTSCDNISGRLYNDVDSDCNYDAQIDDPIRARGIKLIYNGQLVQYRLTDSYGEYSFTAVSGLNYDVVPETLPLNMLCPGSGSHAVTSLPAANLDFAMECPSGSQYDLRGQFSGGFVVPGVNRGLYFSVRNDLCQVISGTAKLVLNSQVQYIPTTGSPYTTPDQVVGDTLIFNFSALGLSDNLPIWVKLRGDTTLTISDTVCLKLIVEPIAGDANPANNTPEVCVEVRTSYDPNMKTVYPPGLGVDGRIKRNRNMTYTIHFQNTGNFMASNVYILDTVDTQRLDINTLEIVDYSHPMELRMLDNDILRFNFNNIMLPDSNSNEPESHGYVTIALDQVSGLPDGSIIENTAGIYFDYNPPIITNTTRNTIDMSIGVEELPGSSPTALFEVYPNPASGQIQVDLLPPFTSAELRLLNTGGQCVIKREVGPASRLELSQLPKGFYILQVSTAQHTSQKRIILR